MRKADEHLHAVRIFPAKFPKIGKRLLPRLCVVKKGERGRTGLFVTDSVQRKSRRLCLLTKSDSLIKSRDCHFISFFARRQAHSIADAVRAMSCAECAAERNIASNCEGAT